MGGSAEQEWQWQLSVMSERVAAYNENDGVELARLLGKKTTGYRLFSYSGMVFGVEGRVDKIILGFQRLFQVPTHPGWTCQACGRRFYVEAYARNHELSSRTHGECDAHPFLSEHVHCTNEASFFFKLHDTFASMVKAVDIGLPH